MTTRSNPTTPSAPPDTAETVRIAAHHRSVRELGHWTAARRFEVRASGGSVTLDLRSRQIEAGEIAIDLDLDRSMVKLLVPDGATIDHHDLGQVGRCGLVDWSGTLAPGGRVIRVTGEMRRSELRVNRGGIAIVSAMLSPEYLADLRRAFRENHVGSLQELQGAYREGRWTTIEDPGRLA